MEIFVQDRVLYEQLCKDYLNLKLLAQNACTSPERLERCKQLIWEDVHSRRKLSRVASFEDLLQLLEQRNLLSLLKPDVIERLELVLSSDDIAKAVKLYRKTISSHYPAIRRFYLEDLRQRDRRSLLEKEVEKIKLAEQSTVSAFHEKYLQQREAIYSLLQNQVGKEWRVFGRYLNIAEAELDEINERHRNDLKSRIYEMLIGVEQKLGESSGEQFISTLTKALENIRRKDLKRKVENMLDV